jgi:hypothetical protein
VHLHFLPQTLSTPIKNAPPYDAFASGQTIYAYALNKPANNVDPTSLYQWTISAGFGPGATLTWGYNGGQLNFGAFVGVGKAQNKQTAYWLASELGIFLKNRTCTITTSSVSNPHRKNIASIVSTL